MEMTIEERIYELVKEQFSKMKFSKKYSNRAILSNKCQHIIYHEWGFSNQNVWDLVDKNAETFISVEMD